MSFDAHAAHEFVRKVARLDHSGDDGYAASEDQGQNAIDTLDLLIAEAREFTATPIPEADRCSASPDGRHHVDTSMEAGPHHCFHCNANLRDDR